MIHARATKTLRSENSKNSNRSLINIEENYRLDETIRSTVDIKVNNSAKRHNLLQIKKRGNIMLNTITRYAGAYIRGFRRKTGGIHREICACEEAHVELVAALLRSSMSSRSPGRGHGHR